MVLGDRGYVFTLLTALMVMLILSMTSFYSEVAAPSYDDTNKKISLVELHYFVESLKKDATRAISISSQRAATYATDHIIVTNETFRNYGMKNCTEFRYFANGSEAAIAELMVCGTLNAAKQPVGDISIYMENNTVTYWIGRTNAKRQGIRYKTTVFMRNMTMALYDPWHYIVVTEMDFFIEDEAGGNIYRGTKVPLTSVVDVTSLEDPMQHAHFGVPTSVRTYRRCEPSIVVNGSVLESWIDRGCYLPSSKDYNAPSYFDRLEGNTNLSMKFLERSWDMLRVYNYTTDEIGLESLMDLDLVQAYNVSVNLNLSQVDYMYWGGEDGRCTVDDMKRHSGFKIDFNHGMKYQVKGLVCRIDVGYDIFETRDSINPREITVPKGTTILWVEKTGTEHKLWAPEAWEGEVALTPGGSHQWTFPEPRDYTITSTPPDNNYGVQVIHVV